MGLLELQKLKKVPFLVISRPEPEQKKKTLKRSKPIKPRSKKHAAAMRELAKLVPIFLANHPICEIKSPICKGQSNCVHHVRGRGSHLLNQEEWKASCDPCNGYVETNDAEARAKGHKKSRLTKPKK